MKKIILGAAVALSIGLPATAIAQRAPAGAQILVVNTQRIVNECNACRAATAQLQAQANSFNQLQQTLGAPLQTEEQQLQTAVQALNGRQPDAALQGRITSFRQRQSAAAQQLQQADQTLRSTQAHVNQQIGQRLVVIAEQIRAARNAVLVVGSDSSLAHNPANEITTEVLAAMNTQLPAVTVTPLPQQAPAAGAQQPAPTGR